MKTVDAIRARRAVKHFDANHRMCTGQLIPDTFFRELSS